MLFSTADLQVTLNQHGPCQKYWLAFSGGLDSTVLLHSLVNLSPKVTFAAIHINHGLYQEAEVWADHCREVCRLWGVEFHLKKVDARALNNESPEGAARDARYQALASYLGVRHALLTAHHQDDQAETLLLQLFRGAGVPGLASMPVIAQFAQGVHIRPLLSISQGVLREYADHYQLQWLDDHSNADERFDRNFVRHQLMPKIQSRWPSIGKVITRAAGLQAEAAGLLAELAQIDLVGTNNEFMQPLEWPCLLKLSPARQRNALRYWIRSQGFCLPSHAILKEIIRMLEAGSDRLPCVCWAGQTIRRYRNRLYLMSNTASGNNGGPVDWKLSEPLELSGLGLTLRREALPADLNRYLSGRVHAQIRFRQGGERIRLPGRHQHHRLKHIFQERGVPPWLRDQLPLVFIEGRLLAVLGLDTPILAAEVYD